MPSWLRLKLLAKVVAGIIVLLLLLVVASVVALTHHTTLPLEQEFGNVAVGLAAEVGGAGNQANPVAGNQRAIQAGLIAYTGSCAQCHGDKGDGKGAVGQSTFPPASSLTSENAKEASDATLFWIVKNGLSFTAMPGYKSQYADADIWALVAYIRQLQQEPVAALAMPPPTMEQLAEANPQGDAEQRGAAVYFAQGCQSCHGAIGNAPGGLGLGGGRGVQDAVRGGRLGMPAYAPGQITDTQMSDLVAYMDSFAGQKQGLQPGQIEAVPSTGPGSATP